MQTAKSLAPLQVAWQITNDCNLACLHCIEASGPGRAFKDELDAKATYSILDEMLDLGIAQLSLSGGEPMLHPLFFPMVERACERGAQVTIETNGHFLTPSNSARLKVRGVRAVQVSLDGATSATFGRMRVNGEFDKAITGIGNLRAAGVPIEIRFAPASFNVHEAAKIVDLAFELGASSFLSGRTLFTGSAVKAWRHLAIDDGVYDTFFRVLRDKAIEYDGRMRVHYHAAGLLQELRYHLHRPASQLNVLPNGLVKPIKALPFVCGDLRHDTLPETWDNLRRAWQDPRVSKFVEDLAANPGMTKKLHQWVRV